MAIQSFFPPITTRPISQGRRTSQIRALFSMLGIQFSIFTWLLLGACLQTALFLAVGLNIYTLSPPLTILVLRLIDSTLMAFNIKPNIYMADVIKRKVSALHVDPSSGEITPASDKIAILLLGAKSNHPFGIFAPGFGELAAHLDKMNVNLDDNAANGNGFLGQTSYVRTDERGAIETCLLSYWRDLAAVHEFAHSPVHKEAWVWWETTLKQHDYIGINHEIYEADRNSWENVYANFQPTGLGATTYLKQKDAASAGALMEGEVAFEWLSPLVDVSRGKLAKSSGRLGWEPTKHDENSPSLGVY